MLAENSANPASRPADIKPGVSHHIDPARKAGLLRVLAICIATYGDRARRREDELTPYLAVLDLVLAPWSIGEIEAATIEHCARSPHPPMPADLRAILVPKSLPLPDHDEALALIWAAVSRFGYRRMGEALQSLPTPEVRQVATDYWQDACAATEDNKATLRAQMREAYRVRVHRRILRESQPGGLLQIGTVRTARERLAGSAPTKSSGGTGTPAPKDSRDAQPEFPLPGRAEPSRVDFLDVTKQLAGRQLRDGAPRMPGEVSRQQEDKSKPDGARHGGVHEPDHE